MITVVAAIIFKDNKFLIAKRVFGTMKTKRSGT